VYAVFRPIYTKLPPDREGKQYFSVEMQVVRGLAAKGPAAALEEAKRGGFVAPIVGLIKGN
jgi:hypothetical protein